MSSQSTQIQLTIPEENTPVPPATGTVQIGDITIGQEVYFGSIITIMVVAGYLIFVLWRKHKQKQNIKKA
jgi:H+/gluconate symporter-like permease